MIINYKAILRPDAIVTLMKDLPKEYSKVLKSYNEQEIKRIYDLGIIEDYVYHRGHCTKNISLYLPIKEDEVDIFTHLNFLDIKKYVIENTLIKLNDNTRFCDALHKIFYKFETLKKCNTILFT